MTSGLSIVFSEHHRLAAILACLESLAEADSETLGKAQLDSIAELLGYLRDFVYRHHHPKEDDFLFPALLKQAPDAAADIQALESQHATGAKQMEQLQALLEQARSGDRDAADNLLATLASYVGHERRHMLFENERIFARAQQLLSPEDWEPIDRAFNDHDDPLFGDAANSELRHRFLEILAQVPAPYGLADPAKAQQNPQPQGPWSYLKHLLGG